MPQISSSQKATPSTHSSAAVADVLNRIQVRDPTQHTRVINGRRLSDYEDPWSKTPQFIGWATLLGICALLFWSSPVPSPVRTETPVPRTQERLAIPQTLHPVPPVAHPYVAGESDEVPMGPEHLKALYVGPRILELEWDSLGEGYVYRIYTAARPTLENAQPIPGQPIPASHALWEPDEGIGTVWVAVKGISPDGKETTFSRPLNLRFPS